MTLMADTSRIGVEERQATAVANTSDSKQGPTGIEHLLVPWGIQWSPRIKHGNYKCPSCSWDLLNNTFEQCLHTVGFSIECPHRRPDRTPDVGCIIVRCPKCVEYFWNHIQKGEVRVRARISPFWGKYPMGVMPPF
jgi:hypothetical protein